MSTRTRRIDVELAAAAVVAAALGAAFVGDMNGAWVVAGVALAGAASAWLRDSRVVLGVAAAVVAGWLLVRRAVDDAHAGWIGVVGVLGVVAVAAGVGRARRAGLTSRVVLGGLAISGGGVWACVPETDAAGRYAVVVGVAAGAGAVLNVGVGADLVGAAAAGLMFVAIGGAQYRASAVVGALACFALLSVAWLGPVVRRLRAGRASGWRLGGWRGEVVALAGHGLAVVVASRVAGRGQGLVRPVLIVLGLGVVLVGVMSVLQQEGHERG